MSGVKKRTTKKTPTRKKASVQETTNEEPASKVQAPPGVPAGAAGQAVAKCASNSRAEVEKWVKRAVDKGVMGLREEFAELRRYVPADMQIGTFQAHWDAGRNRYKDVPCQDKLRVVLKWPGQQHDYVHANYVATPISPKRFICTQGPLDLTIVDFWHMTIQEESVNLIMLCNTKEKGMDKCAQYWPLNEKETQTYGDVDVTNLSVTPLPEEPTVRLSLLLVKWKAEGKEQSREIRHYQWVDWPDRGVPPCRLTAMDLLSRVRGTKKPIVVHCSAGIGRTGSIVAIEFILERLQTGNSCEAMDELLKELRNQRPYSIQTDLQYLFVHRVMLFYFIDKHNLATGVENIQQKYKKFVEDYDAATA